MKIEGTAEEREFYEGLSKVITSEITAVELKDFLYKIVNSNYDFAGKGPVDVAFMPVLRNEFNDTMTMATYLHFFNSIWINNDFVADVLNGKMPFAELLVTAFHERRHASQQRANDVLQAKPELQEDLDKFDDQFFSAAVNYLKSEVPPSKKDVKSFYSIFQYSFPFLKDQKEKEKYVNDIAFGFYLGSAHEIDARRQSIIEASRFLEYVYDDMAGVPAYQDWAVEQMEYLKKQLQLEAQRKVYMEKAKGFYNIDVSERYLLDIVQKIEDITTEYDIQTAQKSKQKRHLMGDKSEFEWVCEKCLKKFFENKTFTQISNYYAAMLTNPATAHRIDKDGLVYESYDFIVADRVIKTQLDKMFETASEEEKEYLSKLMLSASFKSPLKYKKFSKYFTTEARKEFFVYGVGTKCGEKTFIYDDKDLDINKDFDPTNPDDRQMIEHLLEEFNKNYRVYYGKETGLDDESRIRRQIQTKTFDMFYMRYSMGDDLKKLMARFGYEKEFDQIMQREDGGEQYDLELFNRVRMSMGRGMAEHITVDEYLAQKNQPEIPLLGE